MTPTAPIKKHRHYKHGPPTREDEHLKLLYQVENAIEKAMDTIEDLQRTGHEPLRGDGDEALVEMLRNTKRVCMNAIFKLYEEQRSR
jgi:hypothetical protein